MRPVCIPCKRFFRIVKTGFAFVEGMPVGDNIQPGTAQEDAWKPYKLWMGDKWKCQGCGAEIISGFGHSPIAEHYQPDFAKQRESYKGEYQVNDC